MKNMNMDEIWAEYDRKLNNVLAVNKELTIEISKGKLERNFRSLKWPKRRMIIIGIPYTLLMAFITIVTYQAGAYIMTVGFAAITMIMIATIIAYNYQLYLIEKLSNIDEVAYVQKQLARLKISSYKISKIVFLQLPFWVLCWISIDALKESPFLYGGVNFVLFLAFTYISIWIYNILDPKNADSRIHKIIFSGNEWDPIIKAQDILKQLEKTTA